MSSNLKPRRVLIVSDEMEIGGSQRQIAHLLRGLDRSRWHAELAYFRNRSFLVDELEAAGVLVHRVDKRKRIDLDFFHALIGLLRGGRYDVVHCFSFTAELWVRLALAFVPRTAFVASMRDMGHGLGAMQWRIKRWVCRGARAVISNSEEAATRIAGELGARPPVRVIVNGIETPAPLSAEQRSALRARMGGDDTRALAIFVGRLTHQKNVELLLAALAALTPAERPQVALVGDGPTRASLEADAARFGLADRVRFLGECADSRELIQAADFLVLPSRDEGLSNVVLEAMAAGRAVIATRVGGNPTLIVDGVTGLLVDSEDATGLAAAIRRLADDANVRERCGAAAHARGAERYSIAALADATAAVYDTCMEAA